MISISAERQGRRTIRFPSVRLSDRGTYGEKTMFMIAKETERMESCLMIGKSYGEHDCGFRAFYMVRTPRTGAEGTEFASVFEVTT